MSVLVLAEFDALKSVANWATVDALLELRWGCLSDFGGDNDVVVKARLRIIDAELVARGINPETGQPSAPARRVASQPGDRR